MSKYLIQNSKIKFLTLSILLNLDCLNIGLEITVWVHEEKTNTSNIKIDMNKYKSLLG